MCVVEVCVGGEGGGGVRARCLGNELHVVDIMQCICVDAQQHTHIHTKHNTTTPKSNSSPKTLESHNTTLSPTLSDPTSSPLYTCTESALMISPPRACATCRAVAVFPTAVGPVMMITLGLPVLAARWLVTGTSTSALCRSFHVGGAGVGEVGDASVAMGAQLEGNSRCLRVKLAWWNGKNVNVCLRAVAVCKSVLVAR